MNSIIRGIIAGLIATAVLSLIMIMKSAMGIMPQLDVIAMLAGMMGGKVALGWLAHFMVGIGYGMVFVPLHRLLPGSALVHGILLGIVGWLVMMTLLMPMMGAGLFAMGMGLGMMAPAATFMLHIIFGAILGWIYSRLPASAAVSQVISAN